MKYFYVVEHTFRCVHEGRVDVSEADERGPDADYPDGLAWHFCENYCSQNVVHKLEEISESEPGCCKLCFAHEGKLIGRFATREQAMATRAIDLEQAIPPSGDD